MFALRLALTKLLEVLVTIAVAAMVLSVLWGVISRNVLSASSRWSDEVATNLLAWVALLGAAVAFGQRQHLGVDVVYNKLAPEAQRILAIIVQLLILFFALTVMVYGGSQLVSRTLATGQVTPALGVKVGYIYLSVPISGLFITFFAAEQLLELIFTRPDASATDANGDKE